MITIGLTGNIACGKSTVSRMLADLGAAVIDADEVVHCLQQPGTEVYAAIVARFGASVVQDDGSLDRRRLGSIVFADPSALADLETITHPVVIAHVDEWLRGLSTPAAVVEAVKLVEARMHLRCDSLWVVVCSRDTQLERLRGRGLDDAAVESRLSAQPPLDEKLSIADVVIQNDGTREATRSRVEVEWRKLGLP